MFEFLENHDVFDEDPATNTTLVHFLTMTMETAVLVKNMGKDNEEVFVLASALDDYPTTLEEAAHYKWVHPDDRDWSQDDNY